MEDDKALVSVRNRNVAEVQTLCAVIRATVANILTLISRVQMLTETQSLLLQGLEQGSMSYPCVPDHAEQPESQRQRSDVHMYVPAERGVPRFKPIPMSLLSRGVPPSSGRTSDNVPPNANRGVGDQETIVSFYFDIPVIIGELVTIYHKTIRLHEPPNSSY
jgi:hypothetical protein